MVRADPETVNTPSVPAVPLMSGSFPLNPVLFLIGRLIGRNVRYHSGSLEQLALGAFDFLYAQPEYLFATL